MESASPAEQVTLTEPQRRLLGSIVRAGAKGLVVPGTLGSTARALRGAGLVEYVDHEVKPPRQRATPAGIAAHARNGSR